MNNGLLLPSNFNIPVYEYLLQLKLPLAFQEKVQQFKQHFQYLVPTTVNWSNAGIALLKFTQHQGLEHRLQAQIRVVALAQSPFLLQVQNLGSQPTHTIYAKVVNGTAITAIQKKLKPLTQWLTFNKEHTPFFIGFPQLMLYRKLSAGQYEQLWAAMQQTPFTANTMVEELVLLKRRKGEQAYHPVDHFKLMGLNMQVNQGKLFVND